MDSAALLDMLHVAERLKDTMRHCYTSRGRRESVAEHSWRLALMAFWLKDEYRHLDINKVIAMCLIHDLGEAFTGDIPVFQKTKTDEEVEDAALNRWLATLPCAVREEMQALYAEMSALETDESKLYKALDGMEAIIQHNESDISTWEDHEYELQLVHANDRVAFSPYMKKLREQIREDSIQKIAETKKS